MKRIAVLFSFMAMVLCLAEDFKYPDSIPIECGLLKLRLDSSKFWNINGIIYDGEAVSVDLSGAHWGTVAKFKGIGFIGSGHTENECEKVIDLKIFADGNYIPPQDLHIPLKCTELKVQKKFSLKEITFNYTIDVKDDIIREKCELSAEKKTELDLIYNFMHPWSEKMTDYYIQISDDKWIKNKFKADNSFPYTGNFSWIALYCQDKNAGVVSKLAPGNDAVIFLWDRSQYKKTYLCSFLKKDIDAGEKAVYRMSTAFFRAEPRVWQEKARNALSKL